MLQINSFILFLVLLKTTPSLAAMACPVDLKNQYESVVKIIRDYSGKEDRHCTGTILKGGCFILTAGHCVLCKEPKDSTCQSSKFKIKTGTNSEEDLGNVSDVYLHPGFKDFEKNDVALLKLSKCTSNGMEMDFGPLDSTQEVTVGGYGVVKLNSFISQPTRHMGQNKIAKFDKQSICLGEYVVAEDNETIISGKQGCHPQGQDSGSPLLQNNKIRGVASQSKQVWLRTGKTKVLDDCYTNLRDPVIKSFIEDTVTRLHKSSGLNPGARINSGTR